MPNGKPAGVRCVQLDDNFGCKIFGQPERPSTCLGFSAEPDICGTTREEAITIISELEESSK